MAWKVVVAARHFATDEAPLAHLREHGCEVVHVDETDLSRLVAEFMAHVGDADAVIVAGPVITEEVIRKSPRLKVICRRGVGYDSVDVEAATRERVLVAITPQVGAASVADHALALMLAVCRDILACHRTVVEGRWKAVMGRDFSHKTLGVVGLGRIGKGVVKRASGFDMRVLAYDVARDEDFAAAYGVTYVPLEQLMTEADFISIHTPLSDKTRHIIDEAALRRVKPTAFLVNTARGGLVDERALVAALREGRLAGAGLDVFEDEPEVSEELRALPNVVLSPHSGGYTFEGMARCNLMAAEHVVALMNGRLPNVAESLVNGEIWEAWKTCPRGGGHDTDGACRGRAGKERGSK